MSADSYIETMFTMSKLDGRLSAETVQKNFKNDPTLVNGEPRWTLPMPARFVIAQDGTVLYAEVNPDYARRPDPD